MILYPLKFHPIFIEKLWGGDRLNKVLNKDCSDSCGESWEISAVKGNVSVVSNGELAGENLQSLIDRFKEDLVGSKVYQIYGNEFPLLIKFLDANDDLSVQVHPNDDQAMQKHGTRGKTEMWYVIDSDPGAKLIAGLKSGTDRHTYMEQFEEGKIMDILNVVDVNPGDTFFIPAGKVHTIGKGILLAEVQETSDITYRIYDFDRVDKDGNKRDLHVEAALEVINFHEKDDAKVVYNRASDQENLVTCEHFTTNRISLHKSLNRSYKDNKSFHIYICTNGDIEIEYKDKKERLKKGESILIPAVISDLILSPLQPSELLEVYID